MVRFTEEFGWKTSLHPSARVQLPEGRPVFLQQVTKPGEADADRRPRRPNPEPHAGSEIICLEEEHTRGVRVVDVVQP